MEHDAACSRLIPEKLFLVVAPVVSSCRTAKPCGAQVSGVRSMASLLGEIRMAADAVEPAAAAVHAPAVPIGLPTLAKVAFDGIDLAPIWNSLSARASDAPHD